MKILLLGHREIASNLALSLIAGALPEHRFDVLLSDSASTASAAPPPALGALAAVEDRLCREPDTGIAPFETIAARSGGTAGALPDPNAPEGLRVLARLAPDLVISVRYRRILRDPAIAVPRLGVLNLHSGLLPAYRGMMATFWTMLSGDETMGSTLHYIVDAGIDTGPVIGRAPLPVDYGRSYLANVLSLYGPGCDMVVDAVRRIGLRDRLPGKPQTGGGRYYSMPGAADVARFERAGLRLFDGDELRRRLAPR